MASIFSKIIAGEIPSFKIAEDHHCYAFLDIRPVRPGHVLVVPKQEVDVFFDLEDDVLSDLILFAKRVARAMKAVIPCDRIGVTVIGLEVPHAHIHLIPIDGLSDMDFSKAQSMDSESMREIADKISAAFLSA